MKLLLLIGAFACSITTASAQLSLSPQFSLLKTFAGGSTFYGLGTKLEYGFGDKTVGYGGFNYYLPKSFESSAYVDARNFSTSPSSIQIATKNKLNYIHGFIGAKRYFVGEYDDRDVFGMYGIIELGFMIAPLKVVADEDYDLENYQRFDEVKETDKGLPSGFGLGCEFDLDALYLFVDGKLNIPANRTSNGAAIVVEIPASASLNIGVRIPLD